MQLATRLMLSCQGLSLLGHQILNSEVVRDVARQPILVVGSLNFGRIRVTLTTKNEFIQQRASAIRSDPLGPYTLLARTWLSVQGQHLWGKATTSSSWVR